jgi:hypothetical protein
MLRDRDRENYFCPRTDAVGCQVKFETAGRAARRLQALRATRRYRRTMLFAARSASATRAYAFEFLKQSP